MGSASPAAARAVEAQHNPAQTLQPGPINTFPGREWDWWDRYHSAWQRGPHRTLPEEKALYLLVQVYAPYIEELVMKTFTEAFPLGFHSTDMLYFPLLQCIYIFIYRESDGCCSEIHCTL